MWQSFKQLLNFIDADRKDLLLYARYLLVSVGIWGVLTLNEITVREISLPLKVVVPPNWALTDLPPQRFVFTIHGTRWQTWWHYRSCKKEVVHLYLKPDVKTSFELSDFLSIARRLTSEKADVRILSPNTPLIFYLEASVKKHVSVAVVVTAQFKSGYKAVGNLIVDPPTVEVEGAPSLLSGLKYLYCDTLNLVDVCDSFHYTVALKHNDTRLKLQKQTVDISQAVDQLTENNILVPIKLINAHGNGYIFPNRVPVRYQVPLRYFKRIDESSFHIVADAAELQPGSNKLAIKAQTTRPDLIQSLSCGFNEVSFYIQTD